MLTSSLLFGDALANRCSQVLYRCLEEVGSMKGALYLRIPGAGGFQVVSFYGWLRGTRPPMSLMEEHPLTVRAQRERRTFVVNDASESHEMADFGRGGESPHYLITPIYLQGDWVGLLVQRDRIKGGTFDANRDGPRTLAICDDLATALKEFRIYGAAGADPLPEKPAGSGPAVEDSPIASPVINEAALPPGNPDRQRGRIPPEQRAFFWEIAGILCQLLPASAAALWVDNAEEIRPLLAFSALPLGPDLQRQILAHAAFHLPKVPEPEISLTTRTGMPGAPDLTGSFVTYLPLLLNESAAGHDLLMVFRTEGRAFSGAEIEAARQLGRVLGLHLQEARLHERYHQAFLSVSHRILLSSESRVPALRPHSLATARLARDLALHLDLPTEEVEAVSIAALLHDVGLLLLDPRMLAKPQLTEEEFKKVRAHPELAAVFLKDLRFPFDVLKVIRHHHERWDGQGYPDGLRGTAIPIGSRIISLLDAYEAMSSGKSHRRPRDLRQARAELQNESGAQFDPAIVDAFFELMTRKAGRA